MIEIVEKQGVFFSYFPAQSGPTESCLSLLSEGESACKWSSSLRLNKKQRSKLGTKKKDHVATHLMTAKRVKYCTAQRCVSSLFISLFFFSPLLSYPSSRTILRGYFSGQDKR